MLLMAVNTSLFRWQEKCHYSGHILGLAIADKNRHVQINHKNYNNSSAFAAFYSATLFLTFIAVLAMAWTRESICRVSPSSHNEIKRQYTL